MSSKYTVIMRFCRALFYVMTIAVVILSIALHRFPCPDGKWGFCKQKAIQTHQRYRTSQQFGANTRPSSSPSAPDSKNCHLTTRQLFEPFQVPPHTYTFDPACLSKIPNDKAIYLGIIKKLKKRFSYVEDGVHEGNS